MKVLLHMCCANCALVPVKRLEARGMDVTGFWYNPNIHPMEEYLLRLGAVRTLQDRWGLDMHYHDEYGLTEYMRNVVHHEDTRCLYCYATRLEKTAAAALETGADAFTTTLLVSPYQQIDAIHEIGRIMQERYSVEFLSEDFRDGYREGIGLSKELGLYRQKYCGCIYSEMERHLGGNGKGRDRVAPQRDRAWSRSGNS